MPNGDDHEILKDNVRRGTSVAPSAREDVTLYEYVESRLVAQRTYFEAKFEDVFKYFNTKIDSNHEYFKDRMLAINETTNKVVAAVDLRIGGLIDERFVAQKNLFDTTINRIDERFNAMLATTRDDFQAQRTATEAAFVASQAAIEKANTSAQHAIVKSEHDNNKKFDDISDRFENARVSQREYIDKIVANSRELTQVRFDDAQEAIRKADLATEKRFESVNEFRGQLTDQVARFASRESLAAVSKEANTANDGMNKSLTELGNRLSNLEGRILAYSGAIGVIVAVVSILFSVLIHFWH